MAKKYSLKFWIIFWIIAVLILGGVFVFLQIKHHGLIKVADKLPIISEDKRSAMYLADYFLKNDDTEKVFMVLFQNNMELRPGGGFIGSFGILKIKNGKITDLQVHDLSNFDTRVPNTVIPPYPIKEALHTNAWKLKDSNFSPDFLENAKMAEKFYTMGKGQEKLDGVIGITSNVLISFLKATGPVQIEGYPGTYADKNAVINLEYQVEKAYAEQGIEKGERKNVMSDLAKEIINRVSNFNHIQRFKLAQIILDDLKDKDIQLNFKDQKIQSQMEKANWAGRMDTQWKDDFLMVVDANMASFKSDYHIKRSIKYQIDLSKKVPEIILKVIYNHTAQQKDWMTKDYLTYLRVYVPQGATFTSADNFDNPQFGDNEGRKYFGSLVKVPLGTSKVVEIKYSLPVEFKNKPYNLKIQKQAGVKDIPYDISIIKTESDKKSSNFILNSDTKLDNL